GEERDVTRVVSLHADAGDQATARLSVEVVGVAVGVREGRRGAEVGQRLLRAHAVRPAGNAACVGPSAVRDDPVYGSRLHLERGRRPRATGGDVERVRRAEVNLPVADQRLVYLLVFGDPLLRQLGLGRNEVLVPLGQF